MPWYACILVTCSEADHPLSDYDLCDKCVSSSKTRQAHDVNHVFFPIETPGDKDAYNEARKEAKQRTSVPQSLPVHSSVHCDGCEQYPVVGVRHKCLDCHGEPQKIHPEG